MNNYKKKCNTTKKLLSLPTGFLCRLVTSFPYMLFLLLLCSNILTTCSRFQHAALLQQPLSMEKTTYSDHAVLLVYHRFGESRYPSTNTTVTQFKQQLQFLYTHHYAVLPLSEIIDRLQQHQPLPQHTVAITIDDAYRSAYTKAWPLLKHYHFPFTLFVSTHAIDHRFRSMMNWKQLRVLIQDTLVTIGNHTDTHRHMIPLTANDVRDDIQKAQQRLQTELAYTPELFAYPYGEYRPAMQKIVKKLGFHAALAQYSGVESMYNSFYAVPRFSMNEKYGRLTRFKRIIAMHPLPAQLINPKNPVLKKINNPPIIQLQIEKKDLDLTRLTCYASNQSPVDITIGSNHCITIKTVNPFPPGRARVNCTLLHQNQWYWFGIPVIYPRQYTDTGNKIEG